jgi:MinD superfamily P-loop ATPase
MKIAVASGKGGVGKSMLASGLAMLFAREKKVVAVDADVDAPNLHLWLGQGEDWDIREKISVTEQPQLDLEKCQGCGKCLEICQFGAITRENGKIKINDLLCEGCGACSVVCPQEAIVMQPLKNAELRIKDNVYGFPLISAQLTPGMVGSGRIVDAIREKAETYAYEVMVLDAPGGSGCPVIASLRGIDYAVLVTEPTPSGFADLKKVMEVAAYFKLNFGLVINKWDLNQPQSNEIEKWFGNKGDFLGKINYDQRIFKAIANLKPILETNLPVKEEIIAIFEKLKRRLYESS